MIKKGKYSAAYFQTKQKINSIKINIFRNKLKIRQVEQNFICL